MAEETFQEKTEPATPKRLEELKSKGKVAKSRELTTASVLLVGTATIYMLGREFVMQIVQVMKDFLSFSYGREINQGNIVSLAATVVLRIVMITSPIILTIMVVGIISSVLQTGFIFTLQPLKPHFNSLNPLTGIKKVGFSQQSIVELLKGFLKLSLVGTIGYYSLKDFWANSVVLADSSPSEILSFMGKGAFAVTMKVTAAFVALAAIDYYFQRHKFQQQTKMTKQEVKEEQKQTEGNPLVKRKIRREMIKRHRYQNDAMLFPKQMLL